MKTNTNILSKKPSDNTTTGNSSFIKNDNIKTIHKSSKFNSASDVPIKINISNSNNSFFEALNMILQNKNSNSNSINNTNDNKSIKEISFDSLNTSEFDNSKEITMDHISTPVVKNIIKVGNTLMKIGGKNFKNKSELPNIVELEEEDLISVNSYNKDSNKTTIKSINYINCDSNYINNKNKAFYNAKEVINQNNEDNEQIKIFNFIKNKYETSIKKEKEKNKYFEITPIKKNKIKKNYINNNDYYMMESNFKKKNNFKESYIKQINKKLFFDEKNKNDNMYESNKNSLNDINTFHSPSNSKYEKEQIFFDKSINNTEINENKTIEDNSHYELFKNNKLTDYTEEFGSPKSITKFTNTKEFKFKHNYDKDLSNNASDRGYLNFLDFENIKKDIFLNNTYINNNKKLYKSFTYNFNNYNDIENIIKRNKRKNQYRKYKNKTKNIKININKNIIINNKNNLLKNYNNKFMNKINFNNNKNKYFNYNIYENLLNTDKLTSVKFTLNDISILKLKIESIKIKRITIFSIICSLCEKFKYKRETFYLTISLIDSYLYNLIRNKNENENFNGELIKIHNSYLILISLSCLLISSKIEEKKYVKPITYIRTLYDNDFIQKYFQNNINDISVQKILILEQKVMTLLKWKIIFVNINTWLNWYICQWDLYVDNAYNVKTEIINNYGENNIFYFKEKNEQSYYNYRIINQLIELIKFDLESILYDNKLLVMCTIFICIEDFYKKINTNNKTYNLLYNNFIKFNINENIINDKNYINTMKYCKNITNKFLENNLYNFDLPIFLQSDNNNEKQSYEDFLTFQTFNKNIFNYLKERNIKEDS